MATAFVSYEIATSATSVGQLTLSALRGIVRNVCLNRNDLTGSTGDARIDRAIKMAGDEFVRVTKNTRTTDSTVSFTTASATASLTSISDTVNAQNWLYAEVQGTATTAAVTRIDYHGLLHRRYDGNTAGEYFVAFKDQNTLELDHVPNEELTIRVTYTPYFTDFTIGSSTPTDVTFNVEDRYLQQIANLGAAMYLAREVQDRLTFERLEREWRRWLASCAGEMAYEGVIYELDERAFAGRG